MRKPSPAGNIPLFFGYQLLNSFILDRGIWMLFLVSRGFTLAEIGLIEAIYHTVIFLCEIPTGYLADRYGKRSSLLLSQLLGLGAALALGLGSGPAAIILGFLLGGLVGTLQSGATSALVYESLQAQKKERLFKRMTSHLSAVALVSMGVSGSLGGMLADVNWTYVYLGKAAIHLLSFGLVCLMAEASAAARAGGKTTETAEHKSSTLVQGVTELGFAAQIAQCFGFLKDNRPFLTLSLLGMMLHSMAWTITFYSQLLFQSNGFSHGEIGTLNGAETWISAGLTAIAYIGERRLGQKASIVISAAGFTAFLIMLSATGKPLPLVSAFLMLSVFISYLEPLLESYLNELVPSSMRATMLSVFNMMISCGMIVTFWTIGALADRSGVSAAIQSVLIFWIPLLLVVTLWCLRHLHHGAGTETAADGTEADSRG